MATFKLKSTGEVFGEEKKEKTFKVKSTGEIVTGKYEPKIPTLPNKSGQSNNTPSVKVPGGSLPNALDAAKQVIAKQTPVKQMGIGFNKPTPIPENPFKKVPQTLPYNPAAVKKATDKGFVNGVIARSKTPEELRQYNLQNINPFNRPAKVDGVGGANVMAGLGQFNKSLAQTADFILPDVVTPKFLQNTIDYYKNTGDKLAQNAANVNEEKGVPQWAGQVVQGTVAAVPNAILALMSGGASLGAQTIGQTSTGLVGSVGTAMKELAKNPMFYSSLMQTAGPEYEQAKANGATELEATLTAIIGSIVNAGIEIGGGIEAVAKNPISLKNWVKGMLDEGKEEVLQGIISQAAAKATYGKDKAWVSATDENAVINPGRMAQEFAGGAVVGGVLGGGQMLAGKALGMPVEEDSYLPNRGENEAAARMAGQLDQVYGANKLEGKAVLGEGKNAPESVLQQEQQTTNEPAEPLRLYHGTANGGNFDSFSEEFLGNSKLNHQLGQGFYFTDNKQEANSYLKNYNAASDSYSAGSNPYLHEVDVKIENPFVMGEMELPLDRVKTVFMEGDNNWFFDSHLPRILGNKEIDGVKRSTEQLKALSKEGKIDLLLSYESKIGDGRGVLQYSLDAYKDQAKLIDSMRRNFGYDAIVDRTNKNTTQYVVFDPGKIAKATAANSPAQPALPYNPNAPKPLPKNPAQGKFGEPMGIVANPEAVARAQERREFFQPKPNPEGSRNIEGSVLDNLGQGQAAFATLDNLLAQSKADAAKKPGAKEGIANVLTQRPKKFAKDNLEEQIDKIARKVVDSGRTIDTIGKAVDDKVLYPLYNNAKQSRQAAEYMIGEAQTDINGNRVGESLVSIFDPIKAQGEDYFRDFSTYLYHLHNVDRMSLETNGAQVYQDAIMQLEAENPMLQNATREEVEALASGNSDYREAAIEWLQLDDSLNDLHNKPVFGESVTAEVSRKAAAELARKNPEFAELAEKVYAYNRNLMKYRVDAGLVSQKQADIMNTLYPHYVPTFRDTSSTTGMKISGNQAKVARTVRSATGSNLDLLRIDDSMAEQTMQTVRAAKQNLLGARLLEDALKHQDKVGRHVRSVIDRYNSYDMDEPPQLGNDITIYVGGKPVSMQADDGVMEAFQSIQPRKGERIAGLEAVAKANNTFKRLVTGANPTFLLKNFARDLQDAGLYSGSLIDFAKNYPKAWQEMATGGELWQLYKSQGGTGSSYFDYEKGLKTEGKKNIVDRVEELNMMVEQAPRFAEFVSVLEKEGRTYAGIQKAMLAAADVTVNFGRGGSATQFLNRTFVPFLNPAVQGADKLVRRFSETKGAKEWVGLVGRLALMGVVPALLNELLYDDDEEYQMLNDRDKENNYVFPIGDGVWAKIPKGRALSVFGSAAQRTARFLKGDKDAFNGFIQQAYDQVGVPNPLTNNIFSQVLNADLLDPESPGKTWYGSDIEPQRLQGLPPAERYDEKTDELSKWLGKQLNISPKKINYLLDNYSGVIGDFLLPLSTPQAERNPFASAFTIDSVTSNKLSEEFYTKLDELEQAKNSKTPTAGAAAAYRYMNGVSSEVSANNKKIREIQNDKALNDKEKLEQVRKVRNTNNKLLKDAVDNLPGYMETASKSGVVSGKALDKVYLQTNYKQFGAEYALKKYDSAVYEKAKLANTRGISYEDYYKYKFSVDANGDGSVNQEEAKKQLDNMNLPSYQKAFLWEQQNKSWKKNPYK